VTILAILLAMAAILAWPRSDRARRRLLAVLPARQGQTKPQPMTKPPWSGTRGRRLVAALAGLVTWLVIGGWIGPVVGIGVAIGVDRLLARLEPKEVRERRARLVADLPFAADLLAACLRAGRSPGACVDAVARACGGPLGVELALVAAALRLGAEPRTAWAAFLDEPVLAPFGRAMVRSWDSGAPLSETLDGLAAESRQNVRAAATERARSVGVKAAAPLGLCFLPAFLLIGIVPVVIAAVSRVL
jgi:Flp pilus assembly protein TadB